MKQPKFILTNTGYLRMGMVEMHKDLLHIGEVCYGGGYYEFDFVGNHLFLTGKSYDFGKPKWNWLDSLKVSASYRGLTIVYRDTSGDLKINGILNIEYDETLKL